jgi:hypothetical protein
MFQHSQAGGEIIPHTAVISRYSLAYGISRALEDRSSAVRLAELARLARVVLDQQHRFHLQRAHRSLAERAAVIFLSFSEPSVFQPASLQLSAFLLPVLAAQ